MNPTIQLVKDFSVLFIIAISAGGFLWLFSSVSKVLSAFKTHMISQKIEQERLNKSFEFTLQSQQKVNEAFEKTIKDLQKLFGDWLSIVKKESQYLRTNCHNHYNTITEIKKRTDILEKDISEVTIRISKLEDKP